MKFHQLLLVLPFLCLGFNARAQMPEEASSSSSMPEQWQLSLDVIKSKAQSLMIENNGLQDEYRRLTGQVQQLQEAVYEQRARNAQMENFLQERHGLTDQQLRIGELTQMIKDKKQKVRDLDEQLDNWQRKQGEMVHKIQQLKETVAALQRVQASKAAQAPAGLVQPTADGQLAAWRQKLEEETRREVLLQNQLEDLKTGNKVPALSFETINAQNKALEAHLDVLRLEVLHHFKKAPDNPNTRNYDQLKERKDELETDIAAYESRMDDLRDSSLLAISWPIKRKRLVHEMVQIDGRNNQMRTTIKVLREDIEVLRDQVARLERRLDFARGQGMTP